MQLHSIIFVQLGLTACVSADCCSRPLERKTCLDDGHPTPCCGKGQCNMFCCNCDGGCRTSAAAKGKRDDISPAAGAVDSLYQRVDVNNDNEITLAEYIGWVTRTQGQDVASNVTLLTLWIEKFEAHDVNGDGKIEPNEMERPDGLS